MDGFAIHRAMDFSLSSLRRFDHRRIIDFGEHIANLYACFLCGAAWFDVNNRFIIVHDYAKHGCWIVQNDVTSTREKRIMIAVDISITAIENPPTRMTRFRFI